MLTIYQREMISYIKTFFIWVICVAGMGFACILLYSTMQGDMEEMADSFASMGAFADAFGMSTLSIGTLIGYYATEVGTIHGLGGCMFAAIISTGMLSKEEDGHTGEFLLSLPISRGKIIWAKWLAVTSLIILFNAISVLVYAGGFGVLHEELPVREFLLFHGFQTILDLEVSAICFAISSFMKRNRLGIGLGVVLLLYAFDMVARVVPDLEDIKIASPFSYANAAELLGGGDICYAGLAIGLPVLAACVVLAYMTYVRRDIAA